MINKKLEEIIKTHATSEEERDELWKIVDEIMHHRVMECILDNLDREHHEEFLEKYSKSEFNQEIYAYLEEKSGGKISAKIKEAVSEIETELLNELEE